MRYKNKDLINEYGCIQLIGSIVHQAILDYQNDRFKKSKDFANRRLWENAKSFLFSGRYLEEFLERFWVDHIISPEYIRLVAKKKSLKVGKISIYGVRRKNYPKIKKLEESEVYS